MSFLWRSKRININDNWSKERHSNFFKFCHNFILLSNISDYIVNTGLKYAEIYLSKRTIDLKCISECTLFTTAMILSHKYHEDVDTCIQPMWEMASGLSKVELVKLEWEFLCTINYNLHVSPEDYLNWHTKCNKLYDDQNLSADIFYQPNIDILCNPLNSYNTGFPGDSRLFEAHIDPTLNDFLASSLNMIDLSINDLQLSDTNTVDSGIIIHDDIANIWDFDLASFDDQPNLLPMTNTLSENWQCQTANHYNPFI